MREAVRGFVGRRTATLASVVAFFVSEGAGAALAQVPLCSTDDLHAKHGMKAVQLVQHPQRLVEHLVLERREVLDGKRGQRHVGLGARCGVRHLAQAHERAQKGVACAALLAHHRIPALEERNRLVILAKAARALGVLRRAKRKCRAHRLDIVRCEKRRVLRDEVPVQPERTAAHRRVVGCLERDKVWQALQGVCQALQHGDLYDLERRALQRRMLHVQRRMQHRRRVPLHERRRDACVGVLVRGAAQLAKHIGGRVCYARRRSVGARVTLEVVEQHTQHEMPHLRRGVTKRGIECVRNARIEEQRGAHA